jgi:hypothetical protein
MGRCGLGRMRDYLSSLLLEKDIREYLVRTARELRPKLTL